MLHKPVQDLHKFMIYLVLDTDMVDVLGCSQTVNPTKEVFTYGR